MTLGQKGTTVGSDKENMNTTDDTSDREGTKRKKGLCATPAKLRKRRRVGFGDVMVLEEAPRVKLEPGSVQQTTRGEVSIAIGGRSECMVSFWMGWMRC